MGFDLDAVIGAAAISSEQTWSEAEWVQEAQPNPSGKRQKRTGGVSAPITPPGRPGSSAGAAAASDPLEDHHCVCGHVRFRSCVGRASFVLHTVSVDGVGGVVFQAVAVAVGKLDVASWDAAWPLEVLYGSLAFIVVLNWS